MAVPKTYVSGGLKTASVNSVFSVVCRGPRRGVFGGYEERHSLDVRGILPSMKATTKCGPALVYTKSVCGGRPLGPQMTGYCDAEAPHFDEIWRDWNEGKRETIYLCIEHARELGLEW